MGAPIIEVIKRLKKAYPGVKTPLRYSSPFELLVAVILSAQTTDRQVNIVTENLFRKYRGPDGFARAELSELQRDISSIGFYRAKAGYLVKTARMIQEQYGGRVPKTIEELVELPGVARKTANVVLYNAYGIAEGIAVDTHVIRVARRLGLTVHEDPVRIERDLAGIVPRADWGILAHLIQALGRDVCTARKPRHDRCVLRDICPSADILY